ncbi:MAG TPA: sigma-70 family RNA polymerase sigma factor [Nitrolancea sp.]|nr:sigma-70 family RNA polymerase sigma factor [Nitrolancea sp.]
MPSYRNRGVPFAAWLFRIARNVAIDHARRKRITLTWDLLPEALHPTNTTPESVVLREEASEPLRVLLSQMDTGKRELLALRFAAGLTSREISAVVGKSEAAVKKQLTRILQTIKEQYGEA